MGPSSGAAGLSRLDQVRLQIEFLKRQTKWLGRGDINKLEAHLQGVRELELRAAGQEEGGIAASPGFGCRRQEGPREEHDAIPDLVRTNLDLMYQALACDLTRVATFQLGTALSTMTFPWIHGVPGNENHHALSHGSFQDFNAKLIRIGRRIAEKYAAFLGQLVTTPEDGGTMLDNSLVVWGSELGDGNGRHSASPVPFLLAGGGLANPGMDINAGRRPHAHLLKSICQAMGAAQVAQVGDVVPDQRFMSDALKVS